MAALPEEPKCYDCGGFIYTCSGTGSACTCSTKIVEVEETLPEAITVKRELKKITCLQPRVRNYSVPTKVVKDFNKRRL